MTEKKQTVLPMKAETFTVAILRKMSDIGMCQKKFIVHLVVLLLSMRSRVNYLMLYCYGKYSEKSYHTPGVGYFWSGCAGSVK
ncbi:hypothetical protein C7N43_09630 [Sphingobacteriales bacterium UPWRP_1]|nr:hypothetical protein B6N25_11740 [Sphingobacteriales bacterium TSM_CSS]PSJ77194.1 hypothetical protein C7N43_09630 [Sphingobacteriales bacterium UPWRP_1]